MLDWQLAALSAQHSLSVSVSRQAAAWHPSKFLQKFSSYTYDALEGLAEQLAPTFFYDMAE